MLLLGVLLVLQVGQPVEVHYREHSYLVRPTEGFVLASVDGEARGSLCINLGRHDVKPGLMLAVHRNESLVGLIRILYAYPGDSECKIVKNFIGIRPSDRVSIVVKKL